MHQAIAQIGAKQLGLVTRRQLLDLGLAWETARRFLESGRLEPMHPGTYRIAGYPRSWDQDLMAALLAAGGGSAVSFESAAMHWRLDSVRADRPHVTVVHAQQAKLDGVVVHRTRLFAPGDVVRRGPLRVTSPFRTIIDLAGPLLLDELEDVLDDAIRRRLVSVRELTKRLEIRTTGRSWRRQAGEVTRRESRATSEGECPSEQVPPRT